VPDVARGVAEQARGVDGVLVAVTGGELENSEIHGLSQISDWLNELNRRRNVRPFDLFNQALI
jgi:tellurite resistance protein